MAYIDLQNMVSGLLNRPTATPAMIQGWIGNGIQRIQRELRCPAMEKVVEVDFSPTQPFTGIPVPADFIELIDIFNAGGKRLSKEDASRVKYLMKDAGIPQYYYREGPTWLIGPAPNVKDPTVKMTLVYYAELPALVDPTDTNALVIIATDMLAYAALTYAADYYTDNRGPQWEAKYIQIRDDLQVMADEDEQSGASTVSPSWFWPSDLVAYGWATGGGWSGE